MINEDSMTRTYAIVGTVGVPGSYGGFETLAQNLVDYHGANEETFKLSVYCSAKAFPQRQDRYGTAELRYIKLAANGPQSILYDAISLFDSIRRREDSVLVLGVSGGLFLPLARLISRTKIVTNIDGIEWKREKWTGIAKIVLRASEWAAVRFSHTVVADNQAIADYVAEVYGRDCEVIPYGGDHALNAAASKCAVAELPASYALALCRIEPENNVDMILEAFAELETPLVFVGNWDSSTYGRQLKAFYNAHRNIIIHDPVYEPHALRAIRDNASLYVHGHSAGGTNPALVEMMHFSIPVLAHGCSFNRHSTEGAARYFTSALELAEAVRTLTRHEAAQIGLAMRDIALRRYTWDQVARAYFALLRADVKSD